MSIPLSRIDLVKSDARVQGLVQSIEFRGHHYFDKDGHRVNPVADIRRMWFPDVGQSTIQSAIRQLQGREALDLRPARPVGRPRKDLNEPPVRLRRKDPTLPDLTKLDNVSHDPRVIELVDSVWFTGKKGGHYYDKATGLEVPLIIRILELNLCGRNMTIRAVARLLGREKPPPPRKPKLEAPRKPPEALLEAPDLVDAAAPAKPPAAKRYELTRREDRRRGTVLYGYHDGKGSEAEDVIVGSSEAEAVAEIVRMEKLNRTTIIGFHRNGLPIKINGEHIEEPELMEEENENEFTLA